MFSQPLDLGRFIQTRADSKLEVVPILDILIIVLFFGIFSSAFVLPQGVEVDHHLVPVIVYVRGDQPQDHSGDQW